MRCTADAAQLWLDGQLHVGLVLTLADDGRAHQVELRIAAARTGTTSSRTIH